jgi:glycerophosphoryl diester phosphodiesterase
MMRQLLVAVCVAGLSLGLDGCGGGETVAGPYSGPRSASPYVSGHRGGAAYAPEDTMTAYRNAARLGIDDLETDAWLSSDGVLVLIHDGTLDRTTGCSGSVTSRSLAGLRQCDAGYWYTPGQSTTSPDAAAPHPLRGKGVVIPTAQELFDFAAGLGPYGPTVTIEIKQAGQDGLDSAAALVDLIHRSGIQDRIIVQSFNDLPLTRVRQLDPSIKTLFLGYVATTNLAIAVLNGFDYVSVSSSAPDYTQAYVDAAHAQGRKVVPYTPDSRADLQKFIGLGVDGIITNYPACMMQLLGRPLPPRVLAPEVEGFAEFQACKP